MNQDLLVVLSLLAITIILFLLNRPRMDAVALIMMTALPLTGVVTVSETLAGFSDPNVILVATLFVVGEGLVRTGVAQRLGDLLVRHAGRRQSRLIPFLMTLVAGIGAFMSSTGVVAIFVPVVLRVARNAGIAASRLMMPLSVAALISGMMTLVATAPNLVVNAEIVRQGYAGFRLFDFTPLGIPILIVAILYMLVARHWLSDKAAIATQGVHRPRISEWIAQYGLANREFRIRLQADSPWIGLQLDQLDLRAVHGINIIAIERKRSFGSTGGNIIVQPSATTQLVAGDVLFLDMQRTDQDVRAMCEQFRLVLLPMSRNYFSDQSQTIGMAELMIPVNSRLIGKNLLEMKFRSVHELAVIGIKRGNQPLQGSVARESLRLGDMLLVVGPWRAIRRLQGQTHDLIVLNVPAELEDVVPEPNRAPLAVASLLVVVVLMVTDIVPNVQAALIGALLLGLFRCIDMPSAYRSIHWQSLILIVGMLPFAVALQNTGGIALAAGLLLDTIGDAHPVLVLAVIFLLTAVLGLFISNTATAVLMAPVAVAVAADLQLSIYPFAMTVAVAASSAFMTPVSSPVNTLVVVPGHYRFVDFVKVGVPLTVLVMITTVLLVPVVFPFR